MAQPRDPNAQQEHQQHQNSRLLLDALYCEERHYLDQESEQESEQEDENYHSNNNNHSNNNTIDNRSNFDPLLLVGKHPIFEEEELQFLLSKEEKGNHLDLYESIERNPSLAWARKDGLAWMMKVSAHYDFSSATAILAVNYLDRFFGSFFSYNDQREEKPWMTQLAAVACLSLAAKVEETQVPLLVDLQVGDARYVFEAKTIQRMEILVLSTLQWKMNPVTPTSFVDYIASRLGLGLKNRLICWEFLRRCERLLLSLVCNSRLMCFRPSVMAMATALKVMDGLVEPCIGVEYQNQLFGIPGLDKEKVWECSELIRRELINGSHWQWQSQSNKRKLRSSLELPSSPSGIIDASFSCGSSNDSSAASSVSFSSASSPEPLSKKSRGMTLELSQEERENLSNFHFASADFVSIPPR